MNRDLLQVNGTDVAAAVLATLAGKPVNERSSSPIASSLGKIDINCTEKMKEYAQKLVDGAMCGKREGESAGCFKQA